MAYNQKYECSCDLIKRYRCKCNVKQTDLSTCSELTKKNLIDLCLENLKNIENSILKYPNILSVSVKEVYEKCSEILLKNRNLKRSDQLNILESLRNKTSEFIQKSMEEIKDLEKTQKVIKSFIGFLHNKNKREKNKLILTKFMYNLYREIAEKRNGQKKITLPPRIDFRPKTGIFSKPNFELKETGKNERNSCQEKSVDFQLLRSLTIEDKIEKSLFFHFTEPNNVRVIDFKNNLKQVFTINYRLCSNPLIYNQGDTTIYYFYNSLQSPNTLKSAIKINVKTKAVENLKNSYFSKIGSSAPVSHQARLYFFGGFSISNQKSADSEYFDKLSESWTIISSIPVPSIHTSGVELSNEIYLTSNEFRSVKKYDSFNDKYVSYFDSNSIDLPGFHVFLAAAGEKLFYFYNKGIYRIDQPGNHEFYGALGFFASLGKISQYLLREDKIYILMSSGRIVEFPLSKAKNQAKIIGIIDI